MKNMNTEAIFLFLILLFGLVICYVFSPQQYYESMDNMNTNMNERNRNKNDPGDNVNPNDVNHSKTTYDNYNHFNKQSSALRSGSTFYGGNGGKIVVNTNTSGEQTLTVTLGSGQTPITLTPSQSNSTVEGYTTQSGVNGTITKFYGPNGVTAVVTSNKGNQAIKVTTSQGTTLFTQSGAIHEDTSSGNITSSQYYGSTGTPNTPYNGPVANPPGYNPPGYNPPGVAGYDNPPGYNPPGYNPPGYNPPGYNPPGYNTPGYNPPGYNPPGAAGGVGYNPPGYNPPGYNPPGAAGYDNPPGYNPPGAAGGVGYNPPGMGLPGSQIPPGQEDLYILKSQVVPPVCPACPTGACTRDEPCPACPACARCPEPSFECKKVPNYNSINEDYLPQPIVSDFSSFGS